LGRNEIFNDHFAEYIGKRVLKIVQYLQWCRYDKKWGSLFIGPLRMLLLLLLLLLRVSGKSSADYHSGYRD